MKVNNIMVKDVIPQPPALAAYASPTITNSNPPELYTQTNDFFLKSLLVTWCFITETKSN